jgi:polyferredoxin
MLATGIILFAVVTAAIYFGIRKGIAGIRIARSGPALALSAFAGLGISLMATFLLDGGESQGMVFALTYLVAGIVPVVYLWHTGEMTRRIILAMALESTLAGFVFLAPIMPLEFIGIVNTIAGVSALTPAVIVLGAVIALTLVIGRAFCGQLCPVGSLQELAYAVPVKKIGTRSPVFPELVRLVFFIVTIVSAIFIIDVMAYTGLFELFSLAISGVLLVAAGLVLLSTVLYRPVCRYICPFGVIFSALAQFSLFRLRRTDACIGCRKCERVCPAGCAGQNDAKRECYLCGRCTEACPEPGALGYHR